MTPGEPWYVPLPESSRTRPHPSRQRTKQHRKKGWVMLSHWGIPRIRTRALPRQAVSHHYTRLRCLCSAVAVLASRAYNSLRSL